VFKRAFTKPGGRSLALYAARRPPSASAIPSPGGAPAAANPHLVEFSPPYRSAGGLKYLAGSEIRAGVFRNDRVPEEKATELRAVLVEPG
jgi:hypothetical protein